ncbi:Extracellular exo-alpha-(1-_5)-L-arabinofuranosidase precursor [Caloramator mitchellensis]|uniref:Extracellular exo-alpha-(1->5)-L-arabinofuranosidase n=1 Tax=Caloramator mitchellensis TaxID=908809 RepID=A0A0R3JVP7_CALMK|nr:glycoside hydrolase family 43 protein [Caloramator mitchellensis]KRQ87675.1 Extracellular exo-alpha-(1->5)-L-arabinofuranosidase precursor [Caloramator mitchellensis]
MYYKNPLTIKEIGDPFVLKDIDGKYYCYATSASDGFKVWISKDLVNWELFGYCFKADEDFWGYQDFWAPEVVFYNDKYYMFYTARWKKNDSLRIGVAISDKPYGPFKDMFNGPMFDFGFAAIDAHVFFDDDGRKFMYFSRDCSENIVEGRHESHLYGVELNDDLVSFKGDIVLLTKPEQDWELKSGPEWRWNEGPFMLKRNGIYYLMYSANFYASRDYSVGYATSKSPLGPFKKYEKNPVLFSNKDEISGPGHHSITNSPDNKEMFIVYHTHTYPDNPSSNRQVCIDRIGFDDSGNIIVYGPTNTLQPYPSGVEI